ncbi:helix-turn-helix domain-containing protein [Methylobacterium sp. J-026]|uniref:helix-turn-helix domain-containing protein n=1 Tax=Methylobacterium sp. J-026 TaxID=2836624 RepID=UPI001FB9E5B7|nr:helix-turn-helix transcriptional regulator [Methylobacterium sp. J-026]MCJ2134435.1 helix-turn-helix domain-containing protein [Methylobacterium sp. J-026]
MTAPVIAQTAPKLATDADRTIGSRIATLRAAQGLSQSALGSALGVSFQQVQKYEKGRNRIGAGRLQAIAEVLKVPVETFFAPQLGSTGSGTEGATFLEDPQVMELVTAFARITDGATRAGVLAIVKATAGLPPQPARG